jgi:hypothetical protein
MDKRMAMVASACSFLHIYDSVYEFYQFGTPQITTFFISLHDHDRCRIIYLFRSVVAVVFQNVFHVKMYQNNIFLFFKIHF